MVPMLVSAATRQAAGDRFAFREAGALSVKGKSEPVATFVPSLLPGLSPAV